jgi:hypothetical protein
MIAILRGLLLLLLLGTACTSSYAHTFFAPANAQLLKQGSMLVTYRGAYNHFYAPRSPESYGGYAGPYYYSQPSIGYADPRINQYAPPPAIWSVPPPVVLVPMRPASCGRYRYWNGERCADARFEPPYVGPRW